MRDKIFKTIGLFFLVAICILCYEVLVLLLGYSSYTVDLHLSLVSLRYFIYSIIACGVIYYYLSNNIITRYSRFFQILLLFYTFSFFLYYIVIIIFTGVNELFFFVMFLLFVSLIFTFYIKTYRIIVNRVCFIIGGLAILLFSFPQYEFAVTDGILNQRMPFFVTTYSDSAQIRLLGTRSEELVTLESNTLLTYDDINYEIVLEGDSETAVYKFSPTRDIRKYDIHNRNGVRIDAGELTPQLKNILLTQSQEYRALFYQQFIELYGRVWSDSQNFEDIRLYTMKMQESLGIISQTTFDHYQNYLFYARLFHPETNNEIFLENYLLQ